MVKHVEIYVNDVNHQTAIGGKGRKGQCDFSDKIKLKLRNCGKMEIDQLPVEMLMKVFSYLTSYKAVSLVSKLFYDVGCKVNVRIGLYLNERFFVSTSPIIVGKVIRSSDQNLIPTGTGERSTIVAEHSQFQASNIRSDHKLL